MMVRFSDILEDDKKKGEETPSSKPEKMTESPQEDTGTKKMRMTDSQILSPEEIPNFADPFSASRYSENVKTSYTGLLEKAEEIRDRVKADQGLSHSPILTLLHDIIDQDLIDQLYEYAISFPSDDELPAHSISVTLASLKVGKGMGYDTKKLLRLGFTAFLENVGMYKLPDHILKKTGELTPDEIAVIRKHPELSAQIFNGMGEVFKQLGEVALQVHERSDGSGYPRGLKGQAISEAASIIGLIDVYMAMIKDRPYRDKYIQTRAVKSVLEFGKGKFPPNVVKAFLNQISLFPVNTHIRLNNGSIGRVISTDQRQPMRPTIELLYDGLGRKIDKGKIIQLSESPLLHIVGSVDEKELDSRGI
jgi:HD-GYP domain-containing protein (c-di-GMP phosphodiesterase class II)